MPGLEPSNLGIRVNCSTNESLLLAKIREFDVVGLSALEMQNYVKFIQCLILKRLNKVYSICYI